MNTNAARIPAVLAVTVDELRTKLADVLNLIMIFGFLYGTTLIISGARMIRNGDFQSGKEAIIAGVLIAAAPAIMRILFGIFFPTGSL